MVMIVVQTGSARGVRQECGSKKETQQEPCEVSRIVRDRCRFTDREMLQVPYDRVRCSTGQNASKSRRVA